MLANERSRKAIRKAIAPSRINQPVRSIRRRGVNSVVGTAESEALNLLLDTLHFVQGCMDVRYRKSVDSGRL